MTTKKNEKRRAKIHEKGLGFGDAYTSCINGNILYEFPVLIASAKLSTSNQTGTTVLLD